MSDVFTGSISATTAPAAPREPAPAQLHDTAFAALLERLQQFAAPAPAAAPTTDAPARSAADELQQDLARADQSFTTAMDLRRQLEAAFHRQSS